MKYGYMRAPSPQAKSANLLSQVKTKTINLKKIICIFIEKKNNLCVFECWIKTQNPRTDLPHILIGWNSEEPRECY